VWWVVDGCFNDVCVEDYIEDRAVVKKKAATIAQDFIKIYHFSFSSSSSEFRIYHLYLNISISDSDI